MAEREEDQALADLLRAAAPQQVPPASFSHADVVAASGRARRRRQQLLAGAGAALVVVLGVGAALSIDAPTDTSATASSGGGPEVALDRQRPQVLGEPASVGDCGPVDAAVSAAVRAALPSLTGFAALGPQCPAGTTGLAAGTGAARVEVYLGPAPPAGAEPAASATTPDGRTVTVLSAPDTAGPGPAIASLTDVAGLATDIAAALG